MSVFPVHGQDNYFKSTATTNLCYVGELTAKYTWSAAMAYCDSHKAQLTAFKDADAGEETWFRNSV